MRILALVHKYPPVHNAGAEVMLHAMLVDLARRGHECLVTYPKAKAEDLDGIPIRSTPPGDTPLVEAARRADVVITHLDVTPRAMRIAAAAKRPLVHLVHNDAQLTHHGVTGDRAALVVFNSQWIADRYKAWPGATIIVRPPVTVADYELAGGLYQGQDITLINLTQAKGAPTFYALAEAMPERTFLGVRGAYGTQVERRRRNVEFLRHVPASAMRAEVYARTRILLVPSSYESWGRVAIEASAAGIPVIAHPTPGLLESLGPNGLFATHGRPGEWAKIIDRLDDPVFYTERAAAGIERARELEKLTDRDLDHFALRLEAITSAYARPAAPDERSPMGILSSASFAGRQCPVCGARDCACGDSGINVLPTARRGLPVREYRTAKGHFRLNEDDARRRGLLPNGAELPLPTRRLLTLAGVDLAPITEAYARANDDAREAYLAGVAALHTQALATKAAELLEALEAAPAAPTEPGALADLTEPEVAPGARVGEVLTWAGDDPDRIRQALTLERDAKTPRPTLIVELERRLEGITP